MKNMITDEGIDGFRASFGKFFFPFLWANFLAVTAMQFYNEVYLATWIAGIGFISAAVPTFLWYKSGAIAATRYTSSASMAILVVILINAFSGTDYQIDIHMYIFATIAIMAGWIDWRAVIVFVAVIAVHHLVLNFLYPLAIFPEGANLLRVIFHAGVLILQASFLVWLIQRLSSSIQSADDAVQEANEAQKSAEKLSLERNEAGETITQRQQEVEDLIINFKTNVSQALENVTGNSSQMKKIASDLTEISDNASGQVSLASDSSQDASKNVNTVAVAAEELSSSIGEITRQVEQTNSIVKKASEQAIQTNEQVISLSEKSQKIGAVVSLIQDIAEQTNLLALNATIEAARAGEMGKGFAVVASEVKNLANQTAKATEEISAQVTDIQTSTKDAVEGIQEITKIMSEVDEYTTAIGSSVSQQNEATIEISDNVSQASDGTQDVASNMGNISKTIEQTNKSASQVAEMSGQMDVQIDDLKGSIDDFLKNVARA
ncbi:MAG: chemotaxis protein [Alphaproteobacteria bacterium]|nr:chemotaxis protein [Alphaproteobacteria bacterium]